jgi:hypothetical protein
MTTLRLFRTTEVAERMGCGRKDESADIASAGCT